MTTVTTIEAKNHRNDIMLNNRTERSALVFATNIILFFGAGNNAVTHRNVSRCKV